MAYPFAVYFGLRHFSPSIMITGLVALLGARLIVSREQDKRAKLPYLIGAIGLIVVAARSPVIGLKAYPIVVSLALAGVFGYSLLRPPAVIESIVRVRRPDLPPAIVAYLRNLTIVWTGFFLINAAISAATALSGNMKLWTLYNGLISYMMIGALLIGEFAVRPTSDPAGEA
ncbi:MAG: hypothetical protein ABSG46_12290 [Candidatus Binataceae bacterium]